MSVIRQRSWNALRLEMPIFLRIWTLFFFTFQIHYQKIFADSYFLGLSSKIKILWIVSIQLMFCNIVLRFWCHNVLIFQTCFNKIKWINLFLLFGQNLPKNNYSYIFLLEILHRLYTRLIRPKITVVVVSHLPDLTFGDWGTSKTEMKSNISH